jgi:hypothetical protein
MVPHSLALDLVAKVKKHAVESMMAIEFRENPRVSMFPS